MSAITISFQNLREYARRGFAREANWNRLLHLWLLIIVIELVLRSDAWCVVLTLQQSLAKHSLLWADAFRMLVRAVGSKD